MRHRARLTGRARLEDTVVAQRVSWGGVRRMWGAGRAVSVNNDASLAAVRGVEIDRVVHGVVQSRWWIVGQRGR